MWQLTHAELIEALKTSWKTRQSLTICRYWDVGWEESLEIHTSSTFYGSIAEWCVETVKNREFHPFPDDEYWIRCSTNYLLTPLSNSELNARLEEIFRDRWPLALSTLGEIQETICLFNDWNLFAVIGKTDSNYFGIHWNTTA